MNVADNSQIYTRGPRSMQLEPPQESSLCDRPDVKDRKTIGSICLHFHGRCVRIHTAIDHRARCVDIFHYSPFDPCLFAAFEIDSTPKLIQDEIILYDPDPLLMSQPPRVLPRIFICSKLSPSLTCWWRTWERTSNNSPVCHFTYPKCQNQRAVRICKTNVFLPPFTLSILFLPSHSLFCQPAKLPNNYPVSRGPLIRLGKS